MAKIIKFPNKQNLTKGFFNWLNKPREIVIAVPTFKTKSFKRKVQFLEDDIFNHLCDQHEMRIGDSLDFHPAHYARIDAQRSIKENIRLGRIEQLYTLRKRDLRRKGMKF